MSTWKDKSIDGGHIDRYIDDVKAFKSEGTAHSRFYALRSFNNWFNNEHLNGDDEKAITDLYATDIKSFLKWLDREGYAPKTIAARYDAIDQLFKKLAGEYREIDENPVENVIFSDVSSLMDGTMKTNERSDEFVHITPEEVDIMCEHAPKPKARNKLLFRLLFQTGMRAQECQDLKLDNVDTENRSIEVYSTKPQKEDDKWRTAFYQPSLDSLMSIWINKVRPTFEPAENSEYLFVTNRSEKFGKTRIGDIIRQTAGEDCADIQSVLYKDKDGTKHYRLTPHAFRHGHCMHAVKQDIDISFISEMVGHKSLDMTRRYLDAIESEVPNAYKKFGR